MSCTTILVGKKASYDGSTMIARNDDSPSGVFMPKKFVLVKPEDQPRLYRSVISHLEIPLPEDPMAYTAVPNAIDGEGIWAACGVNEAEVAMTATETITSNARVLGADPLVVYEKAEKNQPEKAGGIGEEDLVVLVLPYIHSAREGVLRLGHLLEKYGTYEMNGIAFSDSDEIWWLETIGGHHWIAKRVPDTDYVVMPNQQGIDLFDIDDAMKEGKENLCSKDLWTFIEKNHLNLSHDEPSHFKARNAFGSHDDADHVYNTPRAWFMLRFFNGSQFTFDGPNAQMKPESDHLPWNMTPEHLITPEDVKYVLSSHYQGTPYDPYGSYGDPSMRGAYRSIGINRNDFLGFVQIRPYMPAGSRAIEWLAFASNAFNAMVPFFINVDRTPAYLNSTTGDVSTESFYWTSRLIAALTDANYKGNINWIERYNESVSAKSHEILNRADAKIQKDPALIRKDFFERVNQEVADMIQKEATQTLNHVLYESSNSMKNSYARSDA